MMKTSRRELLSLGATAGIVSGLPVSSVANATLNDLNKADWREIRGLFRFAGKPPLNAANLCPAFAQVLDAHHEWGERLNADVGFLNRRELVQTQVKSARELCGEVLGVRDISSLALLRNTSEANSIIVSGLEIQPDEEVLLWAENHATNYQSWHYRHQRQPLRVRSLSFDAAQPDDALVQLFVDALTPKTRVVSFSHISNISGTRLPAQAICKAVHQFNPDIFVHLDGAQSWGSVALDLDSIDCDGFSSSAHKWLCGPRGVGVLMLRERWAKHVQPLTLGYDFGFEYPQAELPDSAQRFECLGQRDTAAYAALGTALELHKQIGAQRIEARIAELTQYALKAFTEAGIDCISPNSPGRSHGVVVVDVGGRLKSYGAFLALHNAGYASAFVHGNTVLYRPGGVPEDADAPVYLRICPHIYNSTDDIDAAVAVAKRIKQSNFEIIKELVRFL